MRIAIHQIDEVYRAITALQNSWILLKGMQGPESRYLGEGARSAARETDRADTTRIIYYHQPPIHHYWL